MLLLALGALAAEGVIGQAISQGSMEVDHALAAGIAPLSSGSVVKTTAAPGRIVLQNGVRGSLGPGSLAAVYADRLVLQTGNAAVSAGSGYRLEAYGYTVMPVSGAQAKVEMRRGQVAVTAANGSVAVSNKEGILLARVHPGTPLSFEPAPSSEPVSKVTGKLEKKGDQYVLTDELTHVQVELRGGNLAVEVGHRIEVTGTAKTAGASQQVLEVTKVTRLDAASGATTAAKATEGLSHGTKIGLAVAGTGVAAAAVSLGAISR